MQARAPSYKDLNITKHANQRAFERLQLTTEDQVKRIAFSAKKKGLFINNLCNNRYDKETIGLTEKQIAYLINRYFPANRNDQAYLYKDFVYVFSGFKHRTLISIVPCEYTNLDEWYEKYTNYKNMRKRKNL